ncbi:MAG: LptF/LptG family permease [Mariniblastus sp.]|nr:LptF/LptG family permease [Mariniblastus sp.]
MSIFDRYLLLLFLKIFLICFVSFAGLYLVIHMFTNLDELSAITAASGKGMGQLLVGFYGPALIELFDKMAGILVLVSAIFAVTWIQRKRELLAIEAAGITKGRVVRPIIIASTVILLFSIANRELVIPNFKQQLGRSIQDWTEQGSVPFASYRDSASGMMIRASQLNLADQTLAEAEFELPLRLTKYYKQIEGELARNVRATPLHPAGMLIEGVKQPANPDQISSVACDGATVIFSPRDYAWLKEDQVFIACNLDLEEIVFGRQMAKYASVYEMVQSLSKPSRRFGFGDQVQIHGRILQPVLDLTLLLLGLPLVISRPNQNLFVAAALCMVIVVMVQLTTMASHALGAYSVIQPAVFSAWIPVLVFVPFVPITLGKLK